MDPISNVDRLALILRERLRARVGAAGKRQERTPSSPNSGPRGMAAVNAVAALENADDNQLRRALIQNILADEFGAERINEPKFQQLVARVTSALADEPATSALMEEVLQDLRASGG